MNDQRDARWILIVDDEPMVTQSLESLLRLESPWEVATFNRPADAVESLEARNYAAVVSDFLMPEIDGLELLAEAKRRQPQASRILLTGYADKQNAIRAINEVGLYQYLEKPWDNQDLLLVLRNAVERSELLREIDDKMRRLCDLDQSIEALRARLLKAIV